MGAAEGSQEFADAAHPLVGLTFIEVEDGEHGLFLTDHVAKVRKFGRQG
jgi:hypothetical protein